MPQLDIATEHESTQAQLALRGHVIDTVRLLSRGLAHDFNSPLQILSDATYLLREGLNALEKGGGDLTAIEDVREAAHQATQAFERLKDITKGVAHLIPPSEDHPLVRLEVELGIVKALTRHEWHRDVELNMAADPRLSVSGVPRQLLRQLLIDMLMSVVKDVVAARAASPASLARKPVVEMRAVRVEGVSMVEVVAALPPIDAVDTPTSSPVYAHLLTSYEVTVVWGRGSVSAALPAGESADRLFL